MTAEQLAEQCVSEKLVELVEGGPVERSPASWWHGDVAANIFMFFDAFCKVREGLQRCGDNNGFHISRDPYSVLSPDAALFRRRPPSSSPWREFSPEVAVEIRSPSNSQSDLTWRRHRYLEAGSEQFWLVYQEEYRMEIYHHDGRILTATRDAMIECEGIVAGLKPSLEERNGLQAPPLFKGGHRASLDGGPLNEST